MTKSHETPASTSTAAAGDHDRTALVAGILADLQRDQDAHPGIVYELRGDPDRRDVPQRLRFDGHDEILAGADPWMMASKMANLLSGQLATHLGIWQVRVFTDLMGHETRREDSYLATSCGGSQHWADGGTLHQISSAGFCWTCLHPDASLDQQRHGLIRHPITPSELGQPGYKCFVCGVAGDNPEDGHRDIDHTVIWGEECHPRCERCGRAYQTATPQGIGYEPHKPGCQALQ